MTDIEFIPTARDEGRVGVLEITDDDETHRFGVAWDDMLALQAAFSDREREIRGGAMSDTYHCPEGCGWTMPTDDRNAPYFAISHTYLFHPPEPTPGNQPDSRKRELIQESKRSLREAGHYE